MTKDEIIDQFKNKTHRFMAEKFFEGGPFLIEHVFGMFNRTPGVYSRREQQQRCGYQISALNKVLIPHGLRIVSGHPKGCYTLAEIVPGTSEVNPTSMSAV